MKKQLVVDTCVLINLSHRHLDELLEQYEIVILTTVADEIDHLKESDKPERAMKGRRALRWLRENRENLTYVVSENGEKGVVSSNDTVIIQTAMKIGAAVATVDNGFWARAKSLGAEVIEVNERHELYNGYKKVSLDTSRDEDSETALQFYSDPTVNVFDLNINEYLLLEIRDEVGDTTVHYYKWDGETNRRLRLPKIDKLQPINHLQHFVFDLLNDSDVPIKFIVGCPGSGKTFLTMKILHNRLLKESERKMVLIRNPIGSGENIGFLPGDFDEKTHKFFEVFTQHLKTEQYDFSQSMEKTGKLIKQIPFFIKGTSIENAFIIVDESEDLKKKHFKLIGTRAGEKSETIFLGDQAQSEDKYKAEEALEEVISAFKGHPMVGVVRLDRDERSAVSRAFAETL